MAKHDDIYMKDTEAKTINGFIRALNIFAAHSDEGMLTKFFCEAEHDVIYSHCSLADIPQESDEGQVLSRLGWHPASGTDTWAYFT